MAVLGNCENGPLSPMGRATGPLSPRQGATGLFCKKNLQKRHVAPCLGDRGAVALPMGDRGPFSQFPGTAIYF